MSPIVSKPPVPVPGWSKDANTGKPISKTAQSTRSLATKQNTSAPINLSLSEDERSPNRSSVEVVSPQLGKSFPVTGRFSGSSPPEEDDPLYEYFPLTVDDW